MTSGIARGVLGFILVLSASQAMAACRDDVDKLEAQSRDKDRASIATSSGGQGEAARRQASNQTSGKGATQAKVALNDAKVALGKGDEAGCEQALSKARDGLDKH